MTPSVNFVHAHAHTCRYTYEHVYTQRHGTQGLRVAVSAICCAFHDCTVVFSGDWSTVGAQSYSQLFIG